MKKKVFSLMMTLLLAFMGVAKADVVTVNDGTLTNEYLPLYGWWADYGAKSECIIPATTVGMSEMVGATISQMTFYSSTTSQAWGAQWQVFVKEVTNTTMSDLTGISGATTVYEGALSVVNGQMVVEFTTPYTYNGGNLLIGMYMTTGGSGVHTSFYGAQAASGSGFYRYGSGNSSGSVQSFLPKTTFTYTGGGQGGDQPVYESGLHTLATYGVGDNVEELIDVLAIERPNGAWMEPYHFNLYNDGDASVEVMVIDFLHNNGYFTLESEVPFTLAPLHPGQQRPPWR